jgi:hypothetical protein
VLWVKLTTHWQSGTSGNTPSESNATGAAPGAEPAFLAGKRYKSFEMTFITAYPEKAVLEATALQVSLEFPLDMVWQGFCPRLWLLLRPTSTTIRSCPGAPTTIWGNLRVAPCFATCGSRIVAGKRSENG